MITENLSTLKIHKLSQAQYDRELAAGNLDPSALYLTPDDEVSTINMTIPAGRLLGDINGDGIIDNADYVLLESGVGSAGIKYFNCNLNESFPDGNIPIDYLAADLSPTGDINAYDMMEFLAPDIDQFYLKSYDLLGNWNMVEGATVGTEYPFYTDIELEYADGKHDLLLIIDSAFQYISNKPQIMQNCIRVFARWVPINDINVDIIVLAGNGNVNSVISSSATTKMIDDVVSGIDTGSTLTQLIKPSDLEDGYCMIANQFFQASGYTYLLYLVDEASEKTYKKYMSGIELNNGEFAIDVNDVPDSNIKLHFTRINVGSGASRIVPVYIDTQPKITGNIGDFVVIGDDGNVTTKTVPYAEGASF